MLEKIKNYDRNRLFFIEEDEKAFHFIVDEDMDDYNGFWDWDNCISLSKKDYTIEQIQEIITHLYGEKLYYFHPKEREKTASIPYNMSWPIHEKWKIWYLQSFVEGVYAENCDNPYRIKLKDKKKEDFWRNRKYFEPWILIRIKNREEFEKVKRNYENYKTQKIRDRKYQEYLADTR